MSPGFPASAPKLPCRRCPIEAAWPIEGERQCRMLRAVSTSHQKPEIGRQDEIHEVFRVTLHELAEPLQPSPVTCTRLDYFSKARWNAVTPGSLKSSRRHPRKRTGPTKASCGGGVNSSKSTVGSTDYRLATRRRARRQSKANASTATGRRPVASFRVDFINQFARHDKVYKVCQRSIVVSAASREEATETANKRFAELEGIHDWRIHAAMIEVVPIE